MFGSRNRSKTFWGIAKAMAEQWGGKNMSSVDKELKVYRRALELACHYMEYEYPKKNDDIYYRKDRELEMIFLNKAKEELEEQE